MPQDDANPIAPGMTLQDQGLVMRRIEAALFDGTPQPPNVEWAAKCCAAYVGNLVAEHAAPCEHVAHARGFGAIVLEVAQGRALAKAGFTPSTVGVVEG